MLAKLKGPDTALVDVGNTLSSGALLDDLATRTRAGFIIGTLGALGTKVMAAGPKDLVLGVEWLEGHAKSAGLTVLSVNLLRADGKPAFKGSTVLKVGGLAVAFVGVTGAMEVLPKGGKVLPAAEALALELDRLPAHDVAVLLSTAPYSESLQLGMTAKGKVDFVIDAGEPRGVPPPQRLDAHGWIVPAGQKGQQVGALTLEVGGAGPWTDLDEGERDQVQVGFLDGQVKTLEERLTVARDPQSKQMLAQTLAELKRRRAEQKAKVEQGRAPSGRRFRVAWTVLDSSVADDEALKKEVLKIEPTYSGAH